MIVPVLTIIQAGPKNEESPSNDPLRKKNHQPNGWRDSSSPLGLGSLSTSYYWISISRGHISPWNQVMLLQRTKNTLKLLGIQCCLWRSRIKFQTFSPLRRPIAPPSPTGESHTCGLFLGGSSEWWCFLAYQLYPTLRTTTADVWYIMIYT